MFKVVYFKVRISKYSLKSIINYNLTIKTFLYTYIFTKLNNFKFSISQKSYEKFTF